MGQPFFFQPEALIFEVSGRDSERYLNARLSNNMRTLAAGASCFAAQLSPQGRNEGYFQVLRLDKERFLLIGDGSDAAGVRQALTRYIVADRVAVSLLSPDRLVLLHCSADAPISGLQLPASGALISATDVVFASRSRTGSPGVDIILPATNLDAWRRRMADAGLRELSSEEQLRERILGNRPAFPTELHPEFIFLEAGISDSVSFTKGCYVGQEVVEKVDSHGRAPYMLQRLSIEGTEALAVREVSVSEPSDGRASIGEVLSSAAFPEQNRTLAFARIKNRPDLPSIALHIAGRPAVLFQS